MRGCTLKLYELRFEIEEADEDRYEAVEESFDITVAKHGNTTYLTASVEDSTSAIAAARKAIHALTAAGIRIHRLCEDLVTRTEIAERTGKTRQAVGLWVRGERRAVNQPAFPEPYHPLAGGIWLWGEVNAWLQRAGVAEADDCAYPDRCDYSVINAEMLDHRAAAVTYSVVAHFQRQETERSLEPIRAARSHGMSGGSAWTTDPLRLKVAG